MKKCYVVILNFGRWQDTIECLRTVFLSTYTNFCVCIIDNHSQNHSLERITEEIGKTPLKRLNSSNRITHHYISNEQISGFTPAQFADIVFVQNNRNAGFGAGNNLVLRSLLHEDAYIWLLNPDMTVNASTLEQLVLCAQENPRAIIGSVTKSLQRPDVILFYGGFKINYLLATVSPIKNLEKVHQIDYISGGSLFIQSFHLREAGLLPEDYFLYWEETDWCYRALKKGFLLAVCLKSFCFDKISTTIGRGFLSDYYYTRNGLIFLSKYKRWCLLTALPIILIRIMFRLLRGERQRAKGMIKGVIDFLTAKRYENK